MRRSLIFVFVVAIVAVGCGTSGSQVVYVSGMDGNLEIYAVDPDGENQRNLTNSPSDEFAPRLSPNGDLISFLSSSAGGTALEVMSRTAATERSLPWTWVRL